VIQELSETANHPGRDRKRSGWFFCWEDWEDWEDWENCEMFFEKAVEK
jgi:hypothetical protein